MSRRRFCDNYGNTQVLLRFSASPGAQSLNVDNSDANTLNPKPYKPVSFLGESHGCGLSPCDGANGPHQILDMTLVLLTTMIFRKVGETFWPFEFRPLGPSVGDKGGTAQNSKTTKVD